MIIIKQLLCMLREKLLHFASLDIFRYNSSYTFISSDRSHSKSYYHNWAGVSFIYLEIFVKIQRTVCNVMSIGLSSRLQSICRHHDRLSLCLLNKYFQTICYNELSSVVCLRQTFSPYTMPHRFAVKTIIFNPKFYCNVFSRSSCLWKYFPASFFFCHLASSQG